MNDLQVIHDEASGFWTGKPWLVIRDESEPAVESFKTDAEAFDYVDEMEAEAKSQPAEGESKER